MFPLIYADFHNADVKGRLRLNCTGTVQDLSTQNIRLQPGLKLTLYDDDVSAAGEPEELRADGIVEYSDDENAWVAVIDWAGIQHIAAPSRDSDSPDKASRQRVG